jgi:two-component system response regulator HydG
MSIVLFSSNESLLKDVAVSLKHEGTVVDSVLLTAHPVAAGVPKSIEQAVLITEEGGVVNAGEESEQVRDLIGKSPPLVLCAPPSSLSDHDLLKACGATEIISPRSWKAADVSERVLSQLISNGFVTPNRCGSLWGATLTSREIYSHLERLAPLSEPILILGETGTGKELVAREIHNLSKRSDTYIAVNCPELQPELVNSELFGHEKGAFTGADRSRVGLIAAAGKGSVFLDEIGDLDLHSQARLLRVLEDHKVRRVGANHPEDIKARMVFATNRDLDELSRQGKFRADLHERLRGFTILLTPLRQRKADIPLLVKHFVDEYNREYKTRYGISSIGIDILFQSDWPGNIRELRNVIRKAAAYADSSGFLSMPILQEAIRQPTLGVGENVVHFEPSVDTWRDLLTRCHRTYFRALLAHTKGNREAAIKLSGLSKSQFFEKIKEITKEQ